MSQASCRAVLTGSAAAAVALSARALPKIAEAAGPDPVFAAIETYRASWDELGLAIGEESRAEGAWRAKHDQSYPAVMLITPEEWQTQFTGVPWPAEHSRNLMAHDGRQIRADSVHFDP